MQASAEQQSERAAKRTNERVEESVERAYAFADLSSYPFKKRLLIRAADLAFYFLINLIGRTARFEVIDWRNHDEATKDGGLPIYVFWHDRIFLTTYWWRKRKIVVMTSQSFDGEYIARFIQRFGYGAVRGSSTRGGVAALVEMIRLMRAGLPMGFTIDGPKGPKYVAKIGACLLAKKTGNPLMPFAVEAEKFWRLKSWDNLQIPKPFSRARLIIAEPIYVAADANDEVLENKRQELQKSLDELVARGEQWRESKRLHKAD